MQIHHSKGACILNLRIAVVVDSSLCAGNGISETRRHSDACIFACVCLAWKVVQIQTIGIIYVLYRHNGKEHGNYYDILGLIWELPSQQVMYCCLSLELR